MSEENIKLNKKIVESLKETSIADNEKKDLVHDAINTYLEQNIDHLKSFIENWYDGRNSETDEIMNNEALMEQINEGVSEVKRGNRGTPINAL